MKSVRNVISSLAKGAKVSLDRAKVTSMSREAILGQLESNKMHLNTVNSTIFTLNGKQLDKSYKKMIGNLRDPDVARAIGPECAKVLKTIDYTFTKGGSVFTVMKKSHGVMLKLNGEMIHGVDDILKGEKYVNLKKTRLTHGLLLGVIEASRVYGRFNSYLVALMSHINSGTVEQLPRYVSKFIATHGETYVKLTTQVVTRTGRYSVINDITNLRDNAIDVPMFDGNSAIQAGLITDVLGIENIFLSLLETAFLPIVFIGEAYIDVRHNYYADLQDHKKWMETNVANIEMDMAGKDPNDPEYVRMKKAAEYYNNKIAELDSKLDSYYTD